MSDEASRICRACGAKFTVQTGGSRRSDVLHCDVCGARMYVLHEDLGDLYRRYLRHPKPYVYGWTLQEDPGDGLNPAEYHAAVEDTLGPCACGGRFRYDAPPRCPTCRSTEEMWDVDEAGWTVIHD